ncbi:MAG: tetraacyldisaccharide 4'-kinase [Magnetovibrionaceae bacterium]
MKAPDFWARKGLAAWVLAPFGLIYGLGTALRVRRQPRYTPPVPVICIGNIIAGGAGKTPVVRDLTERLRARGLNAKVLSKGYGGAFAGPVRIEPETHQTNDAGDEALMLAKYVPVWVAKDRVQGARAMVGLGEAEVIIMDDGHQDPDLAKTASLVVVDAGFGFGNGFMIPAGPLRETARAGLGRAKAIIRLGEGPFQPPDWYDGTVLQGRILAEPAPDLDEAQVFALSGIGRPQKFRETLAGLGAIVVGHRDFPDHHAYTVEEIEGVIAEAQALNARLVTTEKDAMRIPERFHPFIRVLTITLSWDDEAALDAMLDAILNPDD